MKCLIGILFLLIQVTTYSQKESIQHYSCKATIVAKSKNSEDIFTSHIRLKSNNYIWISISGFLGIEGARVMYENDSIFIHDKIHRKKTSFHQNDINEYVNLNLSQKRLEDIITGSGINTNSMWERKINGFTVFSELKNNTIHRYYYNNNLLMKIVINDLTNDSHSEIKIKKYKKITSYKLPSQLKVKILSNFLISDFTINFKKIELNKFTPISFKKY